MALERELTVVKWMVGTNIALTLRSAGPLVDDDPLTKRR